jgi:hypothetical protein
MKKVFNFFLFLIVLFYSAHLCFAKQALKRHDYYPKKENDIYFRVASDMAISGNRLIAVINFDHTVLMFSVNEGIKFSKKLGGPGQGPGEFSQPFAVATFNENIAIKDSQGLSIFDEGGEFRKRYTKYFRGKSMIYQGDRVYHLNFDPENPHLINVISLEGDLLSEFGAKFVLDPSKLKGANPYGALETVHRGKLIYDGQYIFYLNAIFGELFKFTVEGEELLERDLVEMVGQSGKTALKKNEDIWLRKGLKDRSRYPYWPLFIDAAYCEGKIHLLIDLKVHGIKGLERWIIRSLDSETLRLLDEYKIDTEQGSRIHSFTARGFENRTVFYLSIDTEESYIIAEYK